MLDINESVAVITGGSGGIGKTLAQYWIKKGGKVVLADIDAAALERAKEELGGETQTFVCDVTK